jgi:hypothetical protein
VPPVREGLPLHDQVVATRCRRELLPAQSGLGHPCRAGTNFPIWQNDAKPSYAHREAEPEHGTQG